LWLSPGCFAARLAAYALAWWWMARAAGRPSTPPARAAAALMVHAVVTSLAAIDLLMSLLPLWYSTVFGLLVLTGQLLAGTAVAVAMTAHWRAQRVTRPDPPDPPVWRDL